MEVSAAHSQGLQQGAGIGVAASLVLFGVIYAIRRLAEKFHGDQETTVAGCVCIGWNRWAGNL
jgi:hypothetical protein